MTTMTLADLFENLDRHPQRVPLDELTAILERLEISLEDLEPYLHFDDECYQRNLIHEGPGYEALALCWKPGQHSPIHDHRGSSCGMRVVEGTVTETIFKRGRDGMLIAARSRGLGPGEVCGSQDADIHQVSNFQDDGCPLVTLHVYTPPLRRMSTYSLTDTRIREYMMPVHAFAHGAGI